MPSSKNEEALRKTLRLLAGVGDRDGYIKQVLTGLLELLGTTSGSFWLHDPLRDTNELVVAIGDGHDSAGEAFPSTDPTLVRLPVFFEAQCIGIFLFSHLPQPYYEHPELANARELVQLVVPLIRMAQRAEQDRQSAVLDERYRLACEVHDTLAQHFAGILLQLGVAQRIVKKQPEEAWLLVTQASALARRAVEEARNSIWALQPDALEYTDLAISLPHLVTQQTQGTGVQGQIRLYGKARPVPSDIGMNLLRIGQEALNNALRHAQPQHLFVELAFEETLVRLCLQDDGCGFDLENQAAGGGFGMIGMRQRAERIGALLTVRSQLGHGTEITVTVAVPTEKT